MLIVGDSAEHFLKWLQAIDVKPVISGFRSYLDNLFAREVARTLSKDMFKNLDENQREALNVMLTSIANKLTSDVGTKIKSPPPGFYQEQLAETLRVIFHSEGRDEESSA